MYLKIDENVEEKINKLKDGKPAKLLFDMDDGTGPLSKVGTCSIGTHFRLLLVDEDFESKFYDTVMESSMGDLYSKGYSKTYLSDKMVLSLGNNGRIALKSDYEIIDPNFEILDFRTEK